MKHDAGADTPSYRFHHGRLRGIEVAIQPIPLHRFSGRLFSLLRLVLPEPKVSGGRAAQIARDLALHRAHQSLESSIFGVDPTKADELLLERIEVVNWGCPALTDRVHATQEALPRDETGRPLPGHITAARLGSDFDGLVEAILELTGLAGAAAERCRDLAEETETLQLLDALARRYATNPAELLGYPRGAVAGFALNIQALLAGLERDKLEAARIQEQQRQLLAQLKR